MRARQGPCLHRFGLIEPAPSSQRENRFTYTLIVDFKYVHINNNKYGLERHIRLESHANADIRLFRFTYINFTNFNLIH